MKKITKKVLAVVLSFVFVLSAVPVIKPAIVANAANITRGYTTKEEAYNWGSYYDNTNVGTTVQEKETDKWYKFTLGAAREFIFAAVIAIEWKRLLLNYLEIIQELIGKIFLMRY